MSPGGVALSARRELTAHIAQAHSIGEAGAMGQATAPGNAAGTRRGVSGVDTDRAIEALRLAWGTAYDLGFADGAWHACRLDGNGTLITGTTPDELNEAIRADWTAR
jgi:hypothetical protein